MTGEITLSGAVLPVGGIREKALAARRYGITTFILPERNAVDIPDLPEEVRRDMTFVPVSLLDDVLKLALPPEDAPAVAPAPPATDQASATAAEPAAGDTTQPAAAAASDTSEPQPVPAIGAPPRSSSS
jgi:hypothetical protein